MFAVLTLEFEEFEAVPFSAWDGHDEGGKDCIRKSDFPDVLGWH